MYAIHIWRKKAEVDGLPVIAEELEKRKNGAEKAFLFQPVQIERVREWKRGVANAQQQTRGFSFLITLDSFACTRKPVYQTKELHEYLNITRSFWQCFFRQN